MHVGFRKVPMDLVLAAVVAVAVVPLVVLGVGGPVRYLLALALVFLLPGYAISSALFPRDGELDWIRRLAVSVGLSIASVALLGLLLDATPWGLTLGSAVGSLLAMSLALAVVAWWRRLQVPEPDRLSLTLDLRPPRWRDFGRADRLLALAVVLALLSGVGVVAYGFANPPAPARFTEFYLLDPTGGVYNYTLSLNTTAQGLVIVGIHNVEGARVNYTVIVLLVTLQTVYNATSGTNDTIGGNATFLDSFPVEVASGARSEQPYPFTIPVAGDYLLEFRLYIGSPQQQPPYRWVDLHVRVS